MKIIIEHKGVKRLIEGTGFNICASPEDLRKIVDAIEKANMTGYGWMQVRDPKPDEHRSEPNTPPLLWAEQPSASEGGIAVKASKKEIARDESEELAEDPATVALRQLLAVAEPMDGIETLREACEKARAALPENKEDTYEGHSKT